MSFTSRLLGKTNLAQLAACALVPAGILILGLGSGPLTFQDQSGLLLTLVVFSGLLGGLWIGLAAAALQVAYFLWSLSAAAIDSGAAPHIAWQVGTLFHIVLTEADAYRVALSLVAAPLAGAAAGLFRRKLENSRRETSAQERFSNIIFEQAGVAMAYADVSGHILRCNQAYADLVGRTREEVVGMNFKELVDPRDREENWALSRKLVAGLTEIFTLENRYLRKDGESAWSRKVVSLIRDDAGNPSHLLVFATSISDEIALRAELEQSEANYRTLWNSSGTANFLVFAPDFRIEQGNEAAVSLFGAQDQADLARRSLAELSPARQDDGEESAGKMQRLVDQALRDGSARFEWLFRAPDGQESYAAVKLTRVEVMERTGLLCTALDITDGVLLARHQADARRLLAEEVNARTAELEDVTYELHLAQSVGGMGSFTIDVVKGTFSCSPEAARILALDTFDSIDVGEWTAKVHPQDLEAVRKAWDKAVAGAAPFDITYRVVTPEGTRHVKVGARIKRDGAGQPVSAVGALLDLTRLQEIREQTVMRGYRGRVDAILAATAAIQADAEQNIQTDTGKLVNDLLTQFPGWSSEELEAVVQQAIATIKGRAR